MAQKGDLMTARPDIRVLDATIRDGGLVNNFMFTDDFINALYRANVKAGIDYMEFGYKASKELFDVNKFGKWKFCDEAAIREIVGDNNSDMKISVYGGSDPYFHYYMMGHYMDHVVSENLTVVEPSESGGVGEFFSGGDGGFSGGGFGGGGGGSW